MQLDHRVGQMLFCHLRAISVLLIFFGLITPHQPGQGFEFVAMPVVFVFVAGVLADLLESSRREIVLGVVLGVLAAHVVWSVIGLSRL